MNSPTPNSAPETPRHENHALPSDWSIPPEKAVPPVMRALLKLGVGRVADLFEAINRPHHQIDHSPFILNLRGSSPHPEGVRLLQVLNYQAYLGIAKQLEQSPLKGQLIDETRAAVNLGLARLTRDLQVPVQSQSLGYTAPAHTTGQISALTPLEGLPAIHSAGDLSGLRFIVAGSSLGAVVAASRQRKNFGLTGKIGGGAEFLAPHESPFRMGVAVLKTCRDIGKQCADDQHFNDAQRTSVAVMEALAKGFSLASAKAAWLKNPK